MRKIFLSEGNTILKKRLHFLENANGERALGCFIETSDFKVLEQIGISVRARVGSICTAIVPIKRLRDVASLASVKYIQAGVLCKPCLDMSIPNIGVHHIHDGALGSPYKGEGVIIGVYDSGIDWTHPDFIDSTGNSRILYLWDQTIQDGPTPVAEGYDYGTEYTMDLINGAIHNTNGGIEGLDITGHGTHVAGIAGGNGVGAKNGKPEDVYVGVAPNAELMIVKGGDTQFFSDDIFDGIDYMFQKTSKLEPPRPIVVNLSVGGTQKGPHDGTSLFEMGIDQLLNWQNGRAVVISAGNDGDKNIHFSGTFAPGVEMDTIIVEFQISDNILSVQDHISFDVWYFSFADLFSVSVETPSDEVYGPVESGTSMSWTTSEGSISLDNASISTESDKELTIDVFDSMNGSLLTNNLAVGKWNLIFIGRSGQFDGWLYDSTTDSEITSQEDISILVAEPGNCNLGITVGSYVTRLSWSSLLPKAWSSSPSEVGELSEFSSPGPTRDGRNKPDISAPGEFILSTLSSILDISDRLYLVADDSMHWALRGTSMAAPHVTGVTALMFQANPELDASEILSKLINSVRQDENTGATWNPNWGYGKLDGYNAVKTITSILETNDDFPDNYYLFQNYPNPFNTRTIIPYSITDKKPDILNDTKIQIFDIRGRLVLSLYQGYQKPGNHQLVWDGKDHSGNPIVSGIYICRMVINSHVFCNKMAYVQ
ncbi:S8 family serine peptidase [bacterium]